MKGGRYPKIIVWWEDLPSRATMELTLCDKTPEEARLSAIAYGYKPPVWYKPWQHIWGGLGFLTVGYPTKD